MHLSQSWKSRTYVRGTDTKLALKKEILEIPLFLLHFAKAKNIHHLAMCSEMKNTSFCMQLSDKG